MAAVAIPGLPRCHHQPKSSPPIEQQQLLLPPHMALHTSARTYKASSLRSATQGGSSFFPTPPRLQDSPMAGGSSPLELFPTDASSPGADAEAPLRRQHVRYTPELYAELAALLPAIPPRTSQVDILDAAVAHLKMLEDTAAVLEAYKSLQGGASPAHSRADVEVASREAVCFAARLPPAAAARPGALTRVLETFDRRGVEVLAATMTRGGDGAAQVTVTAAPAAPEVVESIKAEIAGIE